MHLTKRSFDIPKHSPDFIVPDATKSIVSRAENQEGPAISSFCFAIEIEENTGYKVRSQDSNCKATEDGQFNQRVPDNRDMSHVSQLSSGTTNQKVDKEEDNDNPEDRGNILYSNQHPNDWMPGTNNPESIISGSTKSEYGGMAIEDDNYKIVNKVIVYGPSNSESSASLNQPRTGSTDHAKSSDGTKSSKLTVSEKAKLINDFYSSYDEIHEYSDTVNEQGSLYDSSVYDTGSNHNVDSFLDFSVLNKHPLPSSNTEPNFLNVPDRIGTFNFFEVTQSENNINHKSNKNQEVDKPASEKSKTVSKSQQSNNKKNIDQKLKDTNSESITKSFEEKDQVQLDSSVEGSKHPKSLNNQYPYDKLQDSVVQGTSSESDVQPSIEETEFLLDEENDENE